MTSFQFKIISCKCLIPSIPSFCIFIRDLTILLWPPHLLLFWFVLEKEVFASLSSFERCKNENPTPVQTLKSLAPGISINYVPAALQEIAETLFAVLASFRGVSILIRANLKLVMWFHRIWTGKEMHSSPHCLVFPPYRSICIWVYNHIYTGT